MTDMSLLVDSKFGIEKKSQEGKRGNQSNESNDVACSDNGYVILRIGKATLPGRFLHGWKLSVSGDLI
jgi:hypothetical protein